MKEFEEKWWGKLEIHKKERKQLGEIVFLYYFNESNLYKGEIYIGRMITALKWILQLLQQSSN